MVDLCFDWPLQEVYQLAADMGGDVEIWGDGLQTRSFLFVDECIEATLRFTRSDWQGPVNIGSDELIGINGLADMIAKTAGKQIVKCHTVGPLGVSGRTSDNRLYYQKIGWKPSRPLHEGITRTYEWISRQVTLHGS